MNKRIFYTIFALVVFSLPLRAQYYLTGEDPARLKWNKIKVNSLEIIYPRGTDSLAFRYAYLMEQATPAVMAELTNQCPSLPLVLHPYDLHSNGVVVWTPKRVELQPTPQGIGGGSQNWDKQLVVHEMRHVAQMQRVGEHFFEPLSWFIGQQSEGIAAGLYFPRWFLEGDATLTETKFSLAGRGRESRFLMPYHAYFADSTHFSNDKWYYGSFKHFIPDRYALGYMTLTVAQQNAAPQAMSNIYTDITKYPYWPFMYKKTYKRNYGLSARNLFYPAQAYYSALWATQDARKVPFYEGHPLHKPVTDYAAYQYPVLAQDANDATVLFAAKSSQYMIPHLISLVNGKEKKVRPLGVLNSPLATNGKEIVWAEQVSGPRWAHENFSIIRIYSPRTNHVKTLRPKTRYFNPTPSPDGTRVATAYYRPQGGSEIHVLDVQTGQVLLCFPVPRGEQLTEMAWADAHTLYALRVGEAGVGLYRFQTQTGQWDTVLAPQFHPISSLRWHNGSLYFSSDLSGTDNLFRLDPTSGQLTRLTEARFGAFDPFPSAQGDSLYYARYTKQGYQLSRLATDSLLTIPTSYTDVAPANPPLVSPGAFNIDTVQVPDSLSYPVSKYNKWAHGVRLHSWMPFYFNYDEISDISFQTYYQAVSLGATALFQNTLGTMHSILGYSYHKGFHSGHLRLTYSGMLPVISWEVDFNERFRTASRVSTADNKTAVQTDTIAAPFFESHLYAYIPFTFNGNGWNRGLIPSVRWRFTNDSYYIDAKTKYANYQMLQAGMQYYQVRTKAPRDIFPRLGFGVNAQFATTPTMQSHFSNIFYVQAYGYVPGFMKNQALKVNVAYQEQKVTHRHFYLGTLLPAPRGFKQPLYAPTMASASADYAIPVWVGDPSIPNLIYIKRLQFIPFADYVFLANPSQGKTANASSVGMDFLMDFQIFRIGVHISAGVRYAYTSQGTHAFQFLFSIPAL